MDNNYYNPFTNPESNSNSESKSEPYNTGTVNFTTQSDDATYNAYTQTPPSQKKKGFGATFAKVVAIALVFGLVAGGTGLAIIGFGGNVLGIFADADGNADDNDANNNDANDNDINHSGNNNDTNNNASGDNSGSINNLPSTNTGNATVVVYDVSQLVENAMPCIVAITNISERTVTNFWGQTDTERSESSGTGFLIEQDAEYIYIATNNHVVADSTSLTVQFCDDAIVKAEIKGQVSSKDLAVIKVALSDISKETLSVIRLATLGDSNKLKAGEAAIAIGNALGDGQSVTTGVVSALGRSVTVTDSSTGATIVNNNLIQTDAAINPGNSGGALFNARGEVIGINSVKYSDTSVEGMGYAIPISDAMVVFEKIISGQTIDTAKAGYLGIQGVDSNYGVYVYQVFSGSAAEKAGLKVGDIIVAFEGNTISTMSQLKELISYYSAGEEITLTILQAQGNKYAQVEVKVVLGDASTIEQ